MLRVKLPDGSIKEYSERVRAIDVAQSIGAGLAKATLAAEVDGKVAGYCYTSAYRARIGYRFVVEDSVYVLEEMQGRGIGRKLLMTLIEECATRGYRQMIAVIGDSANAGSIKLHEACGFAHVALFKGIGYKFGRWLDSVQMQRALGEGSDTSPPAPK